MKKENYFYSNISTNPIKLNQNEFDNTRETNELLTYIYKTENLIRPYYSPQNIK